MSGVLGSWWRCGCWILVTALAVGFSSTARADDARLWAALKSGKAFAIMRHALAPGTGDPASFSVDDCKTQRNLSDVGREQSREIGNRFRARGIDGAQVYSSQWCRCKETAKLLGLGDVKELPALNSFFETMERGTDQTQALKTWLMAYRGRRPLVLVSHQVNISALTGRGATSGETVFAEIDDLGKVTVLGSID